MVSVASPNGALGLRVRVSATDFDLKGFHLLGTGMDAV